MFSPFLSDMVLTSDNVHLRTGGYILGFSDFYFEIQRRTGLTLPNPEIPINPSPCLCKTFNGFASAANNGGAFGLADEFLTGNTDCDDDDGTPDPVGYCFDDNDGDDDDDLYSSPGRNLYGFADHYLCVNCDFWRNQTRERCRVMAENNLDYILFDMVHMPAKGCWCHNCRTKFVASPLFCPNPDQDSYDHYVGGTVEANPENMAHLRTLSDFMNFSQEEHFRDLLNTMHQAQPDPQGCLGVVSIGDMPGLISDEYRTRFVSVVDIPKTEWYTPIKYAHNSSFWGAEYTNTANYYSILADYTIPEDIRIAGAFSIVRDASKYGKNYSWMPYHFLTNQMDDPATTINENHSLENNRKIKTMMGFGYVLGTIFSTSLDQTFDDNLLYKNRKIWDISNANLNWIDNTFVNPDLAQVTPIFTLDDFASQLLTNKRQYRWAGILYSEEESHRYQYMSDPDVANILNTLPIPTGVTGVPVPVQSNRAEARRAALTWWHALIPAYAAFNTLYRSKEENPTSPNFKGTYMFPTGFITDDQLYNAAHRGTSGYKALLVPIPTAPRVNTDPPNVPVALSDFVNLRRETQENLSLIPEPLIPVWNDGDWFSEINPAEHTAKMSSLRDQVVQQIGLPDIYVTGNTSAASAHAGFYASETYNQVAVPLVINPAWGIPRTESNGTPLILTNQNTGVITDVLNPDFVPTEIPNLAAGALQIHIKAGGDFSPPVGGHLQVEILSGDMTLPMPIFTIFQTDPTVNGEYIFQVPAFSQFSVVNFTKIN